MGVTGSGKSTVGRLLADKMHCTFYDGDDYHSAANIEKMRRGEPLNDEDRAPWLDRLRDLLTRELATGEDSVLACSALKAVYRQRLLPANPALTEKIRFVWLRISPELSRQRLQSRPGHFMPPTLVDSQFEALEEPPDALIVDAARPPEEIAEIILAAL